jgi:hypothetical protein
MKLVGFFLLLTVQVFSQQTATFEIGKLENEQLTIGDKIVIPVYCSQITDAITGWQIYIMWDKEVLKYKGLKKSTIAFQGSWFENNINNLFAANWLDPTFEGVKLSEGEKLFELEFIYLGGQSDVYWSMKEKKENNLLVEGETKFIAGDFKEFSCNLINGCICENKNQ